jgi:hypothetical protein
VLLVCATDTATSEEGEMVRDTLLSARWQPCEEMYVVAEGETLHGISDRCGDPYILERNPHVHDPDDVFPGLVLRSTSSPASSSGSRLRKSSGLSLVSDGSFLPLPESSL